MPDYSYLPASVVDNIANEFSVVATSIFRNNLLFAFIFGGFAKGYATVHHDIDMFVCVDSYIVDEIERFRAWYLAIHSHFSLPPDDRYPGEIVAKSLLDEKVRFLEGRPLKPEIETLYEYEAILWTDALSGRKLSVVGDRSALAIFERRCSRLEELWRSEVSEMLGQPAPELFAHLDLRRLFKKVPIVYHKLGDNTKPRD
jgi:predicted nucleotidyltransferase